MLKTIVFASALSLFMAGGAAAVTTTYTGPIEIIPGAFDDSSSRLITQPWFGDEAAATAAALAYAAAGGDESRLKFAYQYPFIATNGDSGVLFLYIDYDGVLVPDVFGTGALVSDAKWAAMPVTAVPLPAAGWLFMSALIGLMGKKRLSRRSVH
jgi:hypothetical protein